MSIEHLELSHWYIQVSKDSDLIQIDSYCIVAAMLIYGKLINCADLDCLYMHTVVINTTDSDYFDLHAGLHEWKRCKFQIYSFICFFEGTTA
jgi:hypothetical protein